MIKNPLAEVFGFPIDTMTQEAINHRQGRLCPFHNSSGINCTKVSVRNPLGVCSIFDGAKVVATCPVRFREDYQIISDAANFFFPNQKYVAITEARLKDRDGKAAGNIDITIVALDDEGRILDFGAIEVQAVYISGNVRKVFNLFMEDPQATLQSRKDYPTPDYLSSSRKRLAPQLIFKGGILHDWGKKIAVVVDEAFFSQLPHLQEVDKGSAEIAWMVYGFEKAGGRYSLRNKAIHYTQFESALETITTPVPGDVKDFLRYLGTRIAKGKTMGVPESTGISPEVEPPENPFEDQENGTA